jgi:hypothetical protein
MKASRPPVQEVAVVRQPPAELAIGDLPVVDVPVDQAIEVAEIGRLQERPLRHPRRRLRQRERRLDLFVVHLIPVLAAEVVGRIDTQQVGDVGVDPIEDIQLP